MREEILDKYLFKLTSDFTFDAPSLTIEELDELLKYRHNDLDFIGGARAEGTKAHTRLVNEIHQLGQLKFYKLLSVKDKLDYLYQES